jgi:hypothetical protein
LPKVLSDAGVSNSPNPNNAPNFKDLGGTGFPACAKNTLLFWLPVFLSAFQWVAAYFQNFMNKAG